MSGRARIEWVRRNGELGSTWNPVTGCTPISPGCENCYARQYASRLIAVPGVRERTKRQYRKWALGPMVWPDRLREPYGWSPRAIFVCSMADLFHCGVGYETLVTIWRVMRDNPRHLFLVLTKRPERAEADVPVIQAQLDIEAPLRNVWMGVTGETHGYAVKRTAILGRVPAALRFLSYEPALGPVDIHACSAIDWVIAGGETGHNARPPHPGWFARVRDACVERAIPFFFKGHGAWVPAGAKAPDNGAGVALVDGGEGLRAHKMRRGRGVRHLDGTPWTEIPKEPQQFQNKSAI